MEPTAKQLEAYQALSDDTTTYVTYGGAAGGGKSHLGCEWLMSCCYHLPETRWFIGRDSLTDTRESVLVTFRKVSQMHSFTGYLYRDNKITFSNGSEILFLDLSFYPQKDPLYERFGSMEFTGGWIEEAGQVHFLAFDILKTRIGRHLNKRFGIPSKMLLTCNPKKNWLYNEIYKKWKVGELDPKYAFIPALATDNPHLPVDYLQNLDDISSTSQQKRLRDGDWEYDDSPENLCDYDQILNMFHNTGVKTGQKYITADVARFGSDQAIILVWDGLRVIRIVSYPISKTTVIQKRIRELQLEYGIPRHCVIVDDDGVGGGVVDNLNVKGFVNNSRPIGKVNFNNLQSQCGYKLAELINQRQIYIACDVDPDERETIVGDMEQLKSYGLDNDKKLMMMPKSEIKKVYGQSPDYRDAFLMRMFWELSNYGSYSIR